MGLKGSFGRFIFPAMGLTMYLFTYQKHLSQPQQELLGAIR